MKISVEPAPGKFEQVQRELYLLFKTVHSVKVRGVWSFECAEPRQISMEEAFKVCQKKYFEVGWVH